MVYGRVYIKNLRKKVTLLFDELKSAGKLGEKNFIEAFKRKYPKDYSALEYEYRFKSHEFRKNRKGQPKHIPLRPDKILSNMYRNYFFKFVKQPMIKASKERELTKIRCKLGQFGYKIQKLPSGKYNIIDKRGDSIACANLEYNQLKHIATTLNNKQRIM